MDKPITVRIVSKLEPDAQTGLPNLYLEDRETGRRIDNVTAIEFPTITGKNSLTYEVKVTFWAPELDIDLRLSAEDLERCKLRDLPGKADCNSLPAQPNPVPGADSTDADKP